MCEIVLLYVKPVVSNNVVDGPCSVSSLTTVLVSAAVWSPSWWRHSVSGRIIGQLRSRNCCSRVCGLRAWAVNHLQSAPIGAEDRAKAVPLRVGKNVQVRLWSILQIVYLIPYITSLLPCPTIWVFPVGWVVTYASMYCRSGMSNSLLPNQGIHHQMKLKNSQPSRLHVWFWL